MAKNKIGLQFSGFEDVIIQLNELQGDVRSVVNEALIESQNYVAAKVKSDMVQHHRTGRTEESIISDKKVTWEGLVAGIGVGFDIANGGLASIFLMYGTPRIPKDTKLYNDIYGGRTKNEVGKIQSEIFQKAIAERMG